MADRLKERAAQIVTEETEDEERSVDDVLQSVGDRLNALRNSIVRYGNPVYGAGYNGYGDALSVSGVQLCWTLGADEDHCNTCPALADGGPYAQGNIPTWPRAGDTECFDNCYCTITADEDTWNDAFGND